MLMMLVEFNGRTFEESLAKTLHLADAHDARPALPKVRPITRSADTPMMLVSVACPRAS